MTRCIIGQDRASPRLQRDAEHVAVPGSQRLWILACNEDAAHTGNVGGLRERDRRRQQSG